MKLRRRYGHAQEAAAEVLGARDGTYEIADYAQAYWKARHVDKTSMAEAERRALKAYEDTVQAMALVAIRPEEGWR